MLRDNLFGLELDPRCVQIAAFFARAHGMEGRRLPRIASAERRMFRHSGPWTA